jgi:LmbE family N-acetylglucosaminyl deacetylase
VAVAAFEAAGNADRYPSSGPTWTPSKLYYAVVPRSAFAGFAERLREAGIELPFQREADAGEEPPFGVPDEVVTTRIDVSAYVKTKREALAAHRTQMGPDQWFMRLPEALFAETFGRETFQRVAGPGDAQETDLFAALD